MSEHSGAPLRTPGIETSLPQLPIAENDETYGARGGGLTALWQVSGGTPHEETLRVGGVGLGEFARVKLSMIQSLDDYEATG